MDFNNLVDPLGINVLNRVVEDLEEAEGDFEAAVAVGENNFNFIDPFESLSEENFRKIYRVTKGLAREIIELVRPHMRISQTNFSLSVETRVIVALRFFASGSYQEITGSNIFSCVSQPSVSRAILEVTTALNHPDIFNQWVKFARNLQELNTIRQRFFNRYGFPGIIGCIDCTHVTIVRPVGNEEFPEYVYVNRKMYHSINVQLICDDRLMILNVNARFPGSVHDVRIWRESRVSNAIEQLHVHYPNTYFLLGDSGYPQRPWLLTPIHNPPAGSPEERYNNAQSSIRSTVERCNGVLKNRFRCLLKHRVLHYTPPVASHIINACIVLHNMCIASNVELQLDDNEEEIIDDDELGIIHFNHQEVNAENDRRIVNPELEAGVALRQHIVRTYFY